MLSTILTAAAVEKPVFVPSASDSATALDVAITCPTPGAGIRYTLNGEDPTTSDPFLRSGSTIRIARTATLKARAWDGGVQSDVTEEDYRITGAIAMGGQHGLALSRAGKVWSWGYQANGRLGNGQTAGIAVLDPVRVLAAGGLSNLDDAVGIAAGQHHSVVLGSNGAVQSFGWGVYGSLGHGLTTDSSLPVSVVSSSSSGPPLVGARSISAGEYFSLAALQTGEVYSWGLRNNGRLGDGLTSGNRTYAMPVQRGDDPSFPALDGIHEVSAGPSFGMAREAHGSEVSGSLGRIWVWGSNSQGQLGTGNQTSPARAIPMLSAAGVPLTDAWSVSGGESHIAVVRWKDGDPNLQGSVWCSGRGWQGVLGNGINNISHRSLYPVQVIKEDNSPLTGITQVAAGATHTLAVDLDGAVWAWGSNAYGQLGNDSQTVSAKAVRVLSEELDPVTGLPLPLTGIVSVGVGGSSGNASSIALDENGEIWVWGRNNLGQLGNGEQTVWGATKLAIQHEENNVDEGAPSVSLAATIIETVAPGEVSLTATPAHSALGGISNIHRVDFYFGGKWIKTLSGPPWTVIASDLTVGDHHAYAIVSDNEGVTAMSPSISVTIDPSLSDDPDGDGLTTEFELTTSLTDPNNADTDGDGMDDGYEQWNGFSPVSLELGTSKAAYGDFDGDGVANKVEHDTGRLAKVYYETFFTVPPDDILRIFVRTGFITSVEYSTNLTNWVVFPRAFVGRNAEETVNLNDWSAVNLSLPSGFFRLRWESVDEDQDGDGMPDLWEAVYNLDVTDDGTINPELGPDGDIDGDGLSNIEEYEAGTDPKKSDTDGDGITDGGEVGSGTSPLSPLERPGAEWITIVGDGGISEKLTERRRIVVPKGKSRLVVIAGESIEFPCYTGGVGPNCPVDGPSEFNDLMEWKVTPSVGDQFVGTVDVNSVHSDWAIAKEKSFFLNGVGPAAILDARVFTAHGDSDLILDIEVAATNIVDDALETTVFAGVLDFAVKDNDFATGVDDMSITAAESDVGFQDKYWIMAPSGGVPANLGGGDAENDTHFAIQIGEDLDLKIEIPPAPPIAPLPPATADPDEFTLNDGVPGPLVVWHGISANTVDVEPVFKMGPADKEVELPIGVKVMKNRTVKVAVWPVYQDPSRSNSEPEIFATETSRAEYEAELETLLNKTFAFQLNAWIEVDVKPDQGADIVYQSTSGSYYAQYDGVKEHQMIADILDPSFDVNVFLIDGFWYHSGDPAQLTTPITEDAVNGWSYPDGIAPPSRVNCAVVNLNNQTRESSRNTVAHEIGHLLVGPGHPDEYDPNDLQPFGGIAAHQTLDVSDHQMRLMVSGDNTTEESFLLVKDEWDNAEEWLFEFIDQVSP